MRREDLIRLIAEDTYGLLNVPKTAQSATSEEDRLISSMIEISNFYGEHQREPEICRDVAERKLANYLKALRTDERKRNIVLSFDEHELLGEPFFSGNVNGENAHAEWELPKPKKLPEPDVRLGEEEKEKEVLPGYVVFSDSEHLERNTLEAKKKETPVTPSSLEDIFADDSLGILDSSPSDIFTLKHVPKTKEKESPDFVARRKPCKDFHKYEMLFKACHADLVEKRRNMLPFAKEAQIRTGKFYVLKGMLVYVAAAGRWYEGKSRKNRRLKCIFENGTVSDMLQFSFGRELYKDGKRVTERNERLLDGFNNITDEDEQVGELYIVRSLSSKPEIKSIPHLYKIGYTTRSVRERLANAENEPSYLMAPVALEKAYQCYNMNTQKLENLLHRFFGAACLKVDVFDHEGERHTPREWFCAPLEEIEQAVGLLVSGEIVKYRYDPDKKTIVGR